MLHTPKIGNIPQSNFDRIMKHSVFHSLTDVMFGYFATYIVDSVENQRVRAAEYNIDLYFPAL